MAKKTSKIHYSLKEKIRMVFNACGSVCAAHNIAKELDSMTFADLRDLSIVLKQMSKGK